MVVPTTPITLATGVVLDTFVTGGTLYVKPVYDGEGVPVVVAGGSVSFNLAPGDITIGAVEIKDHDTDARAHVHPGNEISAASDVVLRVQHVDDTGTPVREATQESIDLNTANTALVLLDLDETGTRQLGVLSNIQSNTANILADGAAIRMSGTRIEGLVSTGNATLTGVQTNTANLPVDQAAIRMSGTRIESLVSTSNATLAAIAAGTQSVTIRGVPVVDFAPSIVDANDRLRVSNPTLVFESRHVFDDKPNTWDTLILGTGATSVHTPNQNAMLMTVGSTSGQKIVRQTFRSMTYIPGTSMQLFFTGVLNTEPKTNCRARIGMFDDGTDKNETDGGDGVFFQLDGTGLSVGLRSSTSGTQSDTIVSQADWNIDRLNGNGPSTITLDPSKVQVFFIDLQWLGAASVRFGFKIDGKILYCHQFNTANIGTSVYMRRGGLPLRYEIHNTGATSGNSTMKQLCSACFVESGADNPTEKIGAVFDYDTGATDKNVVTASETPLLGIRMQASKIRSTIQPEFVSSCVTGAAQAAKLALYFGGTLQGGSWVDVGGTSYAQVNSTATSFIGGFKVGTVYSSKLLGDLNHDVHEVNIGAGIRGAPQEFFVVGQGVTGNTSMIAAMRWREI